MFGCASFVHIPKQHCDKLDPQAINCVFLGYSPTQKGYKCYHPLTQKFYVSKDVTFVESTPFFSSSQAGPQGDSLVQGDHPPSDSPPCDSDIFFPFVQPILTSSQPLAILLSLLNLQTTVMNQTSIKE